MVSQRKGGQTDKGRAKKKRPPWTGGCQARNNKVESYSTAPLEN